MPRHVALSLVQTAFSRPGRARLRSDIHVAPEHVPWIVSSLHIRESLVCWLRIHFTQPRFVRGIDKVQVGPLRKMLHSPRERIHPLAMTNDIRRLEACGYDGANTLPLPTSKGRRIARDTGERAAEHPDLDRSQ